tara:strand:- start:557 stop:751 length:195 start_codon:yes stop_codon:yes gene_type:complete
MAQNKSAEWTRSLDVTESEESVLVEMVSFFNDMGWINDDTQDAYDTLVDKICDPSPFEYSVEEV